MSKNIQIVDFPSPLQPGQPDELGKLYAAVVGKGREAMNWYAERMTRKKTWARTFRVMAILFGSLATLTPIIVQILFLEAQQQQRYSLLASVFAVFGATLVGLDNFMGSSSGWMRYVAAYQALSARLEVLQLMWAREALSPQQPTADGERVVLLELLQTFVTNVHAIVEKETQEWVADFKGNLLLLEKRVEEQRQRAEAAAATPAPTGALSVEVANASKLKEGLWKVHVGNSFVLEGHGDTARVLVGLVPGLHLLRLKAEKDGQPYVSESVVEVSAGKTAAYRFEVK